MPYVVRSCQELEFLFQNRNSNLFSLFLPTGVTGSSLGVTTMLNDRALSQIMQGILCCHVTAQHTAPGVRFMHQGC